MTIEQRMEAVERHSRTLEKRVNRFRNATAVLAVLLVAGVTMGQTAKDARFDEVTCRVIRIVNDDDYSMQIGGGLLVVFDKDGNELLQMGRFVGQTQIGKLLLFSTDGKGQGYESGDIRSLVSIGMDPLTGGGAIWTHTMAGTKSKLE